MSDDNGFSPITTLTFTVELADGRTIAGAVKDRPVTGLFWQMPNVDRYDRNSLVDLPDALQAIVGAFNASTGELHDVIDLP